MKIEAENKEYRKALKYIKQAKPENYCTFKKMVVDLQDRATVALKGG